MRTVLNKLIYVCLFFCLGIPADSQAQIIISNFSDFRHYTKEDGLPATEIYGITEDKYGFLWLATGNGVSRYDGNYFTNFSYAITDTVKQEIGYVESIQIDAAGENIWIGAENGIFYSRVDELGFKKLEDLSPLPDFPLKRTTAILLEDDQILWASLLHHGLLKIDLKTGTQETISFAGEENYVLNRIGSIAEDPKEDAVLWLGSEGGLIRFNKTTGAFGVFTVGSQQDMAENNIRNIYVSQEKVFTSTWGKGIFVFDKRSKQFKRLLEAYYPRSHNTATEFYGDKEDNLWITTNDGLVQYDLHSDRVAKLLNHDQPHGILRGVTFVDSRGIIWLCHQKGLFKYDPLRSQNSFVELEKRNGVQSPMLVRKIIVKQDFIYVLGHNSSGLYKLNAIDYSFETLPIPSFYTNKNNWYPLRDMVEMDDGKFLIVTADKLSIFSPKTQQFHLSALQIKHPHPVMNSVVRDKNNNYWIASKVAGLFGLSFKNNTVKNYRREFDIYREGNHRWMNSLYLDSKNKLWIAKGSSTLMDLNDSTVHCLNLAEGMPFYQDVGGIQEDKQGRIWMAGYRNGLGFTDFAHFNEGVTTKVKGYFSGVYPYNDSLLWTTGNKLGIFNTNTFENKEIELSFNNKMLDVTGPVIPDGKGNYVVGCENGILIYNPEKQTIITEVPRPYIRKIIADGHSFYAGSSLTATEFRFGSGTKHLIFKISSLGFHFADQISYQYKFDGDWQKVGAGQEINLTNLSYGNYQLSIKACNNEGVCNEIPQIYNIAILTPWWASWWAYLLYLGLAVLFADRFYRFQLSKRLAIAESKRLKEINKLKSSLYANITHEFRTPLTVILGMVDTVVSSLNEMQSKAAGHALEMIRRNGKSLLHLVNQMLDLSKLESGNMKLQVVQMDVIPFVKYLGESFHSLAAKKQINLTVYPEIEELWMDMDANKLSVILSNLLSNAIKFTGSGGKIIVHVNQLVRKEHQFFLIKIKDNGQGIPKEELPHVFDRFYQVDNSSARKGEGTGIGLALTKDFVELMNGTIEVKSWVGKGSEFSIKLPVNNQAVQTKDVQQQLNLVPDVLAESGETMQPKPAKSELPLALIIEDNADVAHYLKNCLTGKYQTIHRTNGEAGIETAFERVPDIIICDVMMPVKDGYEVCSTLKADERTDHIPVILLTARASTKDRLTGLSCGADAYLTKPFVKAELLTRLDQLLLLRKKLLKKMDKDNLGHFMKIRAEDPETKFLQKIIRIIHEEISNHSFGSSVHLSRKMQLSESQIYRKLKALTGKSTAVFIRSVRLQKAKEMIQTTDKTIAEIAYDVGFNDPSWFSRAFKEEFGFAPSAISKS